MENAKECWYCHGPVPPALGKKPRHFCSKRCAQRWRYWTHYRETELARGRAWRAANPEKMAVCKKAWLDKHPEAVRRRFRRWRLLADHGIDLNEYERMSKEQNHTCAICHIPPREGQNLDVDHDHATGKIRGLLCGPCNRMLGSARDNPMTLREGALYLERHATTPTSSA